MTQEDQPQQAAKSLHVICDEIEQALKEKPETECQKYECHNNRKYHVKIRYGSGEKDHDDLYLCYDCMKEEEKIAKRWAYIFSAKLIDGETEPVIVKKRGRPKNLA